MRPGRWAGIGRISRLVERGDVGLTDEEIAFNDALASNDSAKQAMGEGEGSGKWEV